MALWQRPSVVLSPRLSMGVGFGTATAQAQTRAYVALLLDNTVSVIGTATNTGGVAGTGIPVCCPLGVAITPDGTRAYVTENISEVSVIDTATNTVVATITVGVDVFPSVIANTTPPQVSTDERRIGRVKYSEITTDATT